MTSKLTLLLILFYFAAFTAQKNYVIGEIPTPVYDLWEEFRNFINMVSSGLVFTLSNATEFVKKEKGKLGELSRACLEILASDSINFKQYIIRIKERAEEAGLDIRKCLGGVDKIEESTNSTERAIQKITTETIGDIDNILKNFGNFTDEMVSHKLPGILKTGSLCEQDFDCYQDLNPSVKQIIFEHYEGYLKLERFCSEQNLEMFQEIFQVEKGLSDEIGNEVLNIRKCYEELSNLTDTNYLVLEL